MPYPTGPGERVRFTTEHSRDPSDCSACKAGRCLQMVISHPKWHADVVVHESAGNLDVARAGPLFDPPWSDGAVYIEIDKRILATGSFTPDLPDAPAVIALMRDAIAEL